LKEGEKTALAGYKDTKGSNRKEKKQIKCGGWGGGER